MLLEIAANDENLIPNQIPRQETYNYSIKGEVFPPEIRKQKDQGREEQ
jgi:hypothetical protein